MDTLSTQNTTDDQRRWLDQVPAAVAAVLWLDSIGARALDTAGMTLVRRIVSAALAGLVELEPSSTAPRAHAAIYHTIRRALWLRLLSINAAPPATGTDSPILTDDAAAALASIEAQDVLRAAPSGRAAALLRVFAGASWREVVTP